jgi:glutathione S-transferase
MPHHTSVVLVPDPCLSIPYNQDDDGFILYESRAIARYIVNKYASQGTRLIPTDLKANALFEQAASVEISYFHPHAGGILYETLYKKYGFLSYS